MLRVPAYPGDFALTSPDVPAVIMAGTGDVITYAQLDDESIRLARVLLRAGMTTGDRVAVLMDNDARYLTVAWAARRIGLYYVPINWHLTAPEVQYIIDNSGATGLIANSECAEIAERVRRDTPRLEVCISVGAPIDGFDDFAHVIASQAGTPLEHETEGDDIIYTSGTTGRPKGGLRPLSGRHPGELDLATIPASIVEAGIGPGTRFLSPGAPLYHAAPLRTAMATTRLGGTNVIMERFDAEAALAAIERHEIRVSQWVPTMFVRLLRLDEDTRRRYDLRSHQLALHGAAPCPPAVKEQMIAWWGPILLEYYGASEGGAATSITSEEWLQHRGSVGRPKVGTLHILDEAGAEVPIGTPGLVYSAGGRPVQYLDDPAKTAAAHSPQGWVTVGDVGYVDDDGYLYLTDRHDFMIISGGVNIYPQEAENLLIQHPKVADVAVIGVPNAEFGQEVKAVVQLVSPSDATDEVAADLLAFCRAGLARYKCPRTIAFIDQLPRTSAGKLYKHRLRELYGGDGSASAAIVPG
jgi:acyl-CoA synthetase (AMP-forming)/AMP-acid ligase II